MPSTLRQTSRWIFGMLCLSILLIPSWASAQTSLPVASIRVLNVPSGDPTQVWISEQPVNVAVEIQLSSAATQNVNVSYITTSTTATSGSDYTPINGTATIPVGSASTVVYIPILDELVAEGEEDLKISIYNPINATLGTPNQITIHINANDEIGFNGFPGNSPAVGESDGSKRIYITYSGGTNQPVTVNYAVTAGTATAGSDFTPINGTVTFQDGWLYREINIPILEDTLSEGPETLVVTLSNPQGASLSAQTSYIVTIDASDQAPLPVASIRVLNVPSSDPAQVWISEQSMNLAIEVRLSAPAAQDVTLRYDAISVSAVGGSDYTPINGTVTIPAGSDSKQLYIPILDELVAEGEETFTFEIYYPVNATLGTPSLITIHINANDEIGFNGFPGNSPAVSESDGSKRIYITYSGGTNQPVTVNYTVSAGTATAGSDFTPISGIVTFQDGWLYREINIPILEDGLNEGPETFIVTLSNPQGASLGAQTSYTVTIGANDLIGFTSSSVTVYEVGGQAQVQVRLNAPSAQEVRVNYSTAAGTALSGQDYTPVSGTLIFAPYETLKTITIPIITDGQNGETAESFAVVLGSAVNAQYTKASSRIFVNIYDNCPPESCYQ